MECTWLESSTPLANEHMMAINSSTASGTTSKLDEYLRAREFSYNRQPYDDQGGRVLCRFFATTTTPPMAGWVGVF